MAIAKYKPQTIQARLIDYMEAIHPKRLMDQYNFAVDIETATDYSFNYSLLSETFRLTFNKLTGAITLHKQFRPVRSENKDIWTDGSRIEIYHFANGYGVQLAKMNIGTYFVNSLVVLKQDITTGHWKIDKRNGVADQVLEVEEFAIHRVLQRVSEL